MNDALYRAARALRETHDGSSSEAASTRSRVLGGMALRSRRRRVLLAIWMPLAAVLAVSSAWAAVTGRIPRLSALLRGAHPATTMTTAATRATQRGGDRRPDEAPGDRSPDEALDDRRPDEAPPAPPASQIRELNPTGGATASATAPRRASGNASASAPTTESSRPARHDREESLYSAAHQAHFVARDPAAALRAWDEYLASYPDGRFAPEARYNRALALVRLGRMDEARAALTPFAESGSGGYRQSEARSLLQALDAGP